MKAFDRDDRFEYEILVGSDDERRFGIIPVSNKRRIEKHLEQQGFTVTRNTRGFDAIVAGDALKQPERYDDVPCFVSDHGPGTKTLRIRNVVEKKRRYDVFVEGRYWMDTIHRFGFSDAAQWHLCGVPKLDTLFWPGYYNREKLLAALNLDLSKKTVLYAPSYRPSCIDFIGDSIAELLPTYNLIVKLHPYSWGGKYASSSQSKRFVKLAGQHRDMVLIPKSDYDFHPFMHAADTVISDTSSALAISLALGKVGIIGDFPYPRMQHSDGFPIVSEEPSDYLKGIFVHLKDAADLEQAAAAATSPDEQCMARLNEYRRYYFYELDGKAGERAADSICRKLGLEPRVSLC